MSQVTVNKSWLEAQFKKGLKVADVLKLVNETLPADRQLSEGMFTKECKLLGINLRSKPVKVRSVLFVNDVDDHVQQQIVAPKAIEQPQVQPEAAVETEVDAAEIEVEVETESAVEITSADIETEVADTADETQVDATV